MPNSKDFSHIKPALANGDNIKLQYALVGEPVQAVGRPDSAGTKVQPAGLWSTAPYKDPKKAQTPKPSRRKKGETSST